MKYWVHICGETVEVDLEGAGRVLVNGREVDASLDPPVGHAAMWSLRLDGERFCVSPDRSDDRWIVTHDGETVPVTVETERSRRLEAARRSGARGTGSGAVWAPMPGLVLRVDVTVGTAVEAGAGLLVLEAMKMENLIRAPLDGVVSRIEVAEGQAVEKGVLLVEISAEAS
jgi:pyruvate carboxylase subunit B